MALYPTVDADYDTLL